MRHLIEYLAKNVLREREELFREGETVCVSLSDTLYAVVVASYSDMTDLLPGSSHFSRPGILVLVNDSASFPLAFSILSHIIP